jgi:hypothetical protein
MPETMSEPAQSQSDAPEEHEAPAPDDAGFDLDPADLGGDKDYKAGDTIPLKVIGHTSEGKLRVQCVHEESKSDPMAGFDEAMAPPPDDHMTG